MLQFVLSFGKAGVIVALLPLWSNTWESEAGWVVSHQCALRTALSPVLRSAAPARRGQV